jgi:hypothetical protein
METPEPEPESPLGSRFREDALGIFRDWEEGGLFPDDPAAPEPAPEERERSEPPRPQPRD